MIQYSSLVLRSRCFRSVEMWRFQVSLLSRCSPRYLTASAWGMVVWLKMSWGQFPLLSEKYCTIGTDSFLGVKTAGAWQWKTPQSSAEVKESVDLYLRFPSGPSLPVLRSNSHFFTVRAEQCEAPTGLRSQQFWYYKKTFISTGVLHGASNRKHCGIHICDSGCVYE